MSLFTLLEAAEFVENNESSTGSNTRATTSRNGRSPVPSTTSDSDSEKGKRRPGGAGTREIHNRLEKNRRAQLKVCFETLKGEIPSLEDRKTSNLNILKSALRYIQNLEKKTSQYTKEREDLREHNTSLRERLKVLSTDIKNLIEHNKKNGCKPLDSSPGLHSPSSSSSGSSMSVSSPATSSYNMSPVSVATQTMPLEKKGSEEEDESDEEINVDDVSES